MTELTLFRPATSNDITSICKITQKADAGLTNVPKTRADVADYITESNAFLSGKKSANRLLFVAEKQGQVLGISGIIPHLGMDRPFFSFKRTKHARKSPSLDVLIRYESLQLTTHFDGFTELASIFLSPEARGSGAGRLLSLGRLGFIHAHRELFEEQLMADIRGWVNETGISPFWMNLTSRFIPIGFDEADSLSSGESSFISDLLPSMPILLNLMPESVSDCAGKAHDLSVGAMRMLESAGFQTTDLCDVFDGGPAIRCGIKDTLISRTVFKAAGSGVIESDLKYLQFTGEKIGFRAALGPADPDAQKAGLEACQALGTTTPFVALAEDRRGP